MSLKCKPLSHPPRCIDAHMLTQDDAESCSNLSNLLSSFNPKLDQPGPKVPSLFTVFRDAGLKV